MAHSLCVCMSSTRLSLFMTLHAYLSINVIYGGFGREWQSYYVTEDAGIIYTYDGKQKC